MMHPAKAFLKRYRALVVRYDSMTREILRMRETLTNTTMQLRDDVVTGSGASDRIGATVARIVDMEAMQADEVAEIKSALKEILDAINSVPDEMQKTVLTLRYVEGLDWISVAEKIQYEERRTFAIHGLALDAVGAWLNDPKRVQENAVVKGL